jgi:hypothetical protein
MKLNELKPAELVLVLSVFVKVVDFHQDTVLHLDVVLRGKRLMERPV